MTISSGFYVLSHITVVLVYHTKYQGLAADTGICHPRRVLDVHRSLYGSTYTSVEMYGIIILNNGR
jgi:hypothetical protein